MLYGAQGSVPRTSFAGHLVLAPSRSGIRKRCFSSAAVKPATVAEAEASTPAEALAASKHVQSKPNGTGNKNGNIVPAQWVSGLRLTGD